MNEVYFVIEADDMHYKVMLSREVIIKDKALSQMLEYQVKYAIHQLSGEIQELKDQNRELQERIYDIARRTTF